MDECFITRRNKKKPRIFELLVLLRTISRAPTIDTAHVSTNNTEGVSKVLARDFARFNNNTTIDNNKKRSKANTITTRTDNFKTRLVVYATSVY